jgi:hypothetical protein
MGSIAIFMFMVFLLKESEKSLAADRTCYFFAASHKAAVSANSRHLLNVSAIFVIRSIKSCYLETVYHL